MEYLHCTQDSNISEIKAHAREAGKIELMGRNDLELTGNSSNWADYADLDWDWQGWNQGAVYCLEDRQGAATAYGRTCFVLQPELSEYDSAIHLQKEGLSLGDEILIPLEDFEIIEVIIDGEYHFSPEEWLDNSEEYY